MGSWQGSANIGVQLARACRLGLDAGESLHAGSGGGGCVLEPGARAFRRGRSFLAARLNGRRCNLAAWVNWLRGVASFLAARLNAVANVSI